MNQVTSRRNVRRARAVARGSVAIALRMPVTLVASAMIAGWIKQALRSIRIRW
jgi:hypothetical protein